MGQQTIAKIRKMNCLKKKSTAKNYFLFTSEIRHSNRMYKKVFWSK